MSAASAQTACLTSDNDSKLQLVQFGIVGPNERRRMALYINIPLYVASANAFNHYETKFHKLPGGRIAAYKGSANDQTVSIVQALEHFVRHPFDRYTGLRISKAFDQPTFAENGTKLVFRLGSEHTVDDVCIHLGMLLSRHSGQFSISDLGSDTYSALEEEDAIRDADMPFYNVRH